ncbi:tyrosyl-DNA phosphodiesterase 1 [Chlorella sorokiniana]|uniref:Tyrosyl-DNA phosphodiesterase 1 n=1 Tax=Chlorella sorokiniana TaxID=3076 RepID=A0A2P6TZD2_CHLSO|nr:tyrosyl-DNA phosphodiesterase 1 [Chlorella sorokiniana]|eukprot:PRW59425.1 tyrosyl-DNA phosphodiesterase 1 [Chlorella sorokiniana]
MGCSTQSAGVRCSRPPASLGSWICWRCAATMRVSAHCRVQQAGDARKELDLLRSAGVSLPAQVDVHMPPMTDAGDRGMHHTKALLLKYATGLRLIVYTGAPDPEELTPLLQVVWFQVQEKHWEDFGGVLFDFVQATLLGFRTQAALDLLRCIASHDYKFARAALVPSVPGPDRGHHTGEDMHKWGHLRLRGLLQREGLRPFKGKVLYGTASLNSMYPGHIKDCKESFGDDLRLLWCSRDTVRMTMQRGFQSGTPLVAKKTAFYSNEVKDMLYHNEGREAVGRELSPPHIKQCCWVGKDGLDAVSVGSHNFSMAAWGRLDVEKGSLFIRHFELSVVSFPSLEAAWRRSEQFGFSCTPPPGAPPPGPDPRMEGCERVVFVAFDASNPYKRAPCVAKAVGGAWVLLVPAPLSFSPSPSKYDFDEDSPWLWGHDYGPDLRDLNGHTYREAMRQPKWHHYLTPLEVLLQQKALAEAAQESAPAQGDSPGSGEDAEDDALTGAAAGEGDSGKRRRRRRQQEALLAEEAEEAAEEEEEAVRRAKQLSLQSFQADQQAAL